MASKCPNCGRVLKWYNVKADCPDCGVSIPNFNWEARLEEDNIRAEEKFAALYKTLNRFKFTVFGTRLRIIRIIVSLLPALGFILPWAAVVSEKATLSFDLTGIFTDGESTISFLGIAFKNIGGIISSMSAESFVGPVSFIMFGFIMMLLSVIAIVVAFFMIFIRFRKSDTKATWITDIVSIVFVILSAVIFMIASSKATDSFAIATLEFENSTVSVLWGTFVYLILLISAAVVNMLVSRSEVASDEVLEAARAEKVRIKEEKEEEEKKRKEAARAEAEKKAEEEQAEKVRKAKEALAKKDKK